MKHIKISDELHDLISFYCFFKKINIQDYVCATLENDKELKEFSKKRKSLELTG